jgi:hypothetical protein
MFIKMNRLSLALIIIILYGLVSCNNADKSNETIASFGKTDACKSDSKNTYEVYIPQRQSAVEKLPLLIIIDAHGSGKFAIDKFKHGADRYSVILVASNLIKNGHSNYEGAIQALIKDVCQKYPVGETIFISGFSGGARMALGYALNHLLDGLILCGALAEADRINALRSTVISISGMDDFNFIETAQYLFQEQSIPGNLKIELINASHNWPDSLVLTNALGFLLLSSQSTDISSLTKSQFTAFCENQLARIDSLKKKGEFLEAASVARNMAFTEPFNNNKNFAVKYKSLINDPEYKNRLNQLKSCLTFEMNAQQTYINAFMTENVPWWRNEIKTIDGKIRTEQDPYTIDMYRRIKAFWGIACYSLSNQAVKEQKVKMLNKILPVYRMLEPENPDMLYFSAFPFYWNGKNEAALSILKKARQAGFSDISRLKKDFSETITSKLGP